MSTRNIELEERNAEVAAMDPEPMRRRIAVAWDIDLYEVCAKLDDVYGMSAWCYSWDENEISYEWYRGINWFHISAWLGCGHANMFVGTPCGPDACSREFNWQRIARFLFLMGFDREVVERTIDGPITATEHMDWMLTRRDLDRVLERATT